MVWTEWRFLRRQEDARAVRKAVRVEALMRARGWPVGERRVMEPFGEVSEEVVRSIGWRGSRIGTVRALVFESSSLVEDMDEDLLS